MQGKIKKLGALASTYCAMCTLKHMKITNLFREKINTEFKENTMIKNTGEADVVKSELLTEHYFKIIVNEQELMSLVCTQNDLVELALGRLISEGMINSADDVDMIYICEQGLRAKIFLKPGLKIEDIEKGNEVASCCTDNKSYFKTTKLPSKLENKLEIKNEEIFALAKLFNDDSKIHKLTQGTHCAYIFHKGAFVKSFEDIGRHNALDKAIGHIYLNEINPSECILFTTGRVPVDMVRKAIYAKIGALVSKAVPTIDATILAKEYNLNLICRAWQDSFQIFNKAE